MALAHMTLSQLLCSVSNIGSALSDSANGVSPHPCRCLIFAALADFGLRNREDFLVLRQPAVPVACHHWSQRMQL
jgi:hypothetical protein